MPNSEELRVAFGPKEDHVTQKYLENKVAALEERIKKEDEKRGWDRLAKDIHVINEDKGFWSEPEMMDKYAAKMMLVVSETVEVIEALRKSQGTKAVTEEFADIFIRALDLFHVLVEAGEADPYLYEVLTNKVETNRTRPAKHGNRWG